MASASLSFFLSVVCSFPPRLCFVFQRLPVALPVHWNGALPFWRRQAKEFILAAHPLPFRCLTFALVQPQMLHKSLQTWVKFQPGFSGFQQKYIWIYNNPPPAPAPPSSLLLVHHSLLSLSQLLMIRCFEISAEGCSLMAEVVDNWP